MVTGEVVETKKAFKSNQKDDNGNLLPLGSVQVRLGGYTFGGQVQNHWARPATFNKRIPLVGEHVIIFETVAHDETDVPKDRVYYYLTPVNTTNDVSLGHLHGGWKMNSPFAKAFGSRLADKGKPGYTFPKSPKGKNPIQIFEGDDIWQGRLGSSIRFGSHIQTVHPPGKGVYEKKPTWKGKSNGDPITIISVKKENSSPSPKYTIEDLGTDDSSLYLTSTHKLPKLKPGFKKNRDVMKAGTFNKTSQAVLDAGRLVLNAKDDIAMLIGKKKAIITSDEVRFQTGKYNVSLDDLMDYLNDVIKQLWQLTTGTKQFSTPAGPTLTSTNVSEVTKLHKADFNTLFKLP